MNWAVPCFHDSYSSSDHYKSEADSYLYCVADSCRFMCPYPTSGDAELRVMALPIQGCPSSSVYTRTHCQLVLHWFTCIYAYGFLECSPLHDDSVYEYCPTDQSHLWLLNVYTYICSTDSILLLHWFAMLMALILLSLHILILLIAWLIFHVYVSQIFVLIYSDSAYCLIDPPGICLLLFLHECITVYSCNVYIHAWLSLICRFPLWIYDVSPWFYLL